jgi:uncharacterized membrane protein YeaQ/YmgE (transglycosylase-associated protein family)
MGMMRARSHRRVPIQMLLFGLVLLGAYGYQFGGNAAAKFAVIESLKKLAIQVPVGVIAVWIASRIFDSDFGTIGTIVLKIAGITILAEGVATWVEYVVPFAFFSFMAELAVMLVGYFWLFELTKWETYLIVFLNFAVLIGANYLLENYQPSTPERSHRSRMHYRR